MKQEQELIALILHFYELREFCGMKLMNFFVFHDCYDILIWIITKEVF